jgi:hypothetical protein
MANITETVPFNFDELYNGLKTKFQEKGYDTAEGSNTSQLITAMAYLTSMLNVNTAVNINETILPLATKRNNALQDARALGYEIQHKQSYSYMLTVALSAGNHTIPKYSEFTVGGKTYYYMGKQIDIIDWVEGATLQLLIIEGSLHKYTEDAALSVTITNVINDAGETVPQYYIDIPYADVEEGGIEVFVTYYDDYGNLVSKEKWYRSEHFMIDADTALNKQYVRLDNIEFKTPRIYFTLAGVGNGIRLGSIVEMNVLTTTAQDGAIADLTAIDSVQHIIDGATIVGIELINEGADEESIESIKLNAPKFYNSANRAVTKSDYEAICNRQSSVETSLVWGGDDEFPKCPGHIWFSFLPTASVNRSFTSDEFKFQFLLDSWGDITWDYALDPVNDKAAWDTQWAQNEIYYNQRFIQDSEIKSYEYTVDGQLIQPGVWDVLDDYKIPTLEFHNRHPMFLDFEYDINIVRYNITDSKAAIHQDVFNAIDNFFTGTNDSVKMEKFEIEYFHSSLEKRVDTVLTDATGYTNTVKARLLLTKKNVAKENYLAEYRDVFIPMSIPFETYFTTDGFLQYNKLPNIDTADFIDYEDGNTYDVWTDWSEIQADINNSIKQTTEAVIVAPIRTTMNESVTLGVNPTTTVTLQKVRMAPDDITTLDEIGATYTFNLTTVKKNGNTLVYNVDWLFDAAHPERVILTAQPAQGDVITVLANPAIGMYHLFNSYKRYIIVQFYVNAVGYAEGGGAKLEFDSPKSYLYSTEGFYDYTIDEFYLTTEGYSIITEDQLNATTGTIVKKISPSTYTNSPLKMDLFRKNRYLNFNYNTKNFAVLKNVIPRLKRVTFLQGA